MTDMNRQVFGSLATVSFPEYGDVDIVAKVDTGAYGCSLHCEDISEDNGVLSFRPFSTDAELVSTTRFTTKDVKSSNGEVEGRYAVKMSFDIDSHRYTELVRLADRSQMRRDMLIGRKFLIDNDILVDVKLSIDQDVEYKEEA